MIIVRLMGGLGNQMFQYALARHLSIKNKDRLKFDLTFLLDRTPRKNFTFRDYDLDVFEINPPITLLSKFSKITNRGPFILAEILYRLQKKLLPNKVLAEKKAYYYDDEVLRRQGNLYIVGYWQCPKYFDDIAAVIRKDFIFKSRLSGDALDLYKKIRDTNSVCINVRRADYVNNPQYNQFHGVTGMDFYDAAIKIIVDKVSAPHFYIFSDDIEWCRSNFNLSYPTTFVGHEFKGPKFSHYLQLMIACKNFIIPNSSFAWWAAWLNSDINKIVIAPKKWVNALDINIDDVLPEEWIKI